MKNHTKVYLKEMGYDTTDWIPCEVCGGNSRRHTSHRVKRNGWKQEHADTIENLMALCSTCHTAYGDIKEYKERLQATHNHHLSKRVI
jgi:5-methylcytosine-specific restriction endonuclease McrA